MTPTSTYQDSNGGNFRDMWLSGNSYAKGDVVTYGVTQYTATDNIAAGGDNPTIDTGHWRGPSDAMGGDAGNSVTSAGSTAQGGGEGGYQDHSLDGTTAPEWDSTKAYADGQTVTFDGQVYTATGGIAAGGADPGHNAAWQLNNGVEQATNARLAARLSAASSKVGAAAPATNLGAAALSTAPTGGTAATIDATVTAGGHVNVWAIDRLHVLGVAGAGAGGLGGLGVSVLVLNVKSATDAGIGGTATILAGAGAGGTVSVKARMADEAVTGVGFVGAAGAIAIGAQVVVINDDSTQNAHIDSSTSASTLIGTVTGYGVTQAGGGIDVSATAQRTADSYAIGIGLGAVAVGVSAAVVNVTGGASATVGNIAVGAFGPVHHLSVSVTDYATNDLLAVAFQAGLAGGFAVDLAFVTLGGTASASSGAHGTLGAGGLSVTADGVHTATARTLNVATGLLAVSVTVARVTNSRSTEAIASPTFCHHVQQSRPVPREGHREQLRHGHGPRRGSRRGPGHGAARLRHRLRPYHRGRRRIGVERHHYHRPGVRGQYGGGVLHDSGRLGGGPERRRRDGGHHRRRDD